MRGRNREQITVEQKFISGFRRSRTPPEAGTGAKRQAGRRSREQITVEQKFISGFQRGRGRPAPSPVKGRGGKGNPRLLSGQGTGICERRGSEVFFRTSG